MKNQPFKLDAHDIGVIRHALGYLYRTGANTEQGQMAAKLNSRIENELPVFPENMMIFPGVDVAALAPTLPDSEETECPDCGSELRNIPGRVCSSPGCPMGRKGLCRKPTGCAACDRGDYQLGHADTCPKKGVPDQTRYAEPGPIRTCPICRGTGGKNGGTRPECKGLRQVFIVPSIETTSALCDALMLWKAGNVDGAIRCLVQIVARLDAALS